MTLEQFIKKYLNKGVDWDGRYGFQCVDLFRAYIDNVLKFPQPRGVRGAADFWTNYSKDPALFNYYEKIPNTPDFVPQKGDVAVWNRRAGGGYGHIAICTGKGNTQWFESFDQNWVPQKATIEKHNYKNFYGVLRPKKQDSGTYKGIDLNNLNSVKVAIDVWKDVVDGKYKKVDEYNKLRNDFERVANEYAAYIKEVDDLKRIWGEKEIGFKNSLNECHELTKELREQLDKIAKKLNCPTRIEDILKTIEGLLNVEDRWQAAERGKVKLVDEYKELDDDFTTFLQNLAKELNLSHIGSRDELKKAVNKAIMGLIREENTLKKQVEELNDKIEQLQKLKTKEQTMKRVVSHKYSLNKHDLVKIGRGALLASTGALALYVAQVLGQVDFGDAWWSPLAVAFVPVVVNALRKWASTNVYMVK